MDDLDIKVLNIDDVNKRILEKIPTPRSEDDVLGPFGRYRDQDYEIYVAKRDRFLEACKKYNTFNEQTFVTCRRRLQEDYENFIEGLNIITEDDTEVETDKKDEEDYCEKGRCIRKRIQKNIHECPEFPQKTYCIEPWFCRYLTLNKFIHAARLIILKRRLLNNLEKLKALTPEKIEELEERHIRYQNVSYAELFEKFMKK